MPRNSRKSATKCPRCRPGPETFWYMKHRYLFDVDKAREIVSDGREPVEVEEECVRYEVRTSELDEEHVAHVNPKDPGIIAFVHFITDDGELITGHLLIDGHHRAARCLQMEKPFLAYLMTEEESVEILIRSPFKHAVQEHVYASSELATV